MLKSLPPSKRFGIEDGDHLKVTAVESVAALLKVGDWNDTKRLDVPTDAKHVKAIQTQVGTNAWQLKNESGNHPFHSSFFTSASRRRRDPGVRIRRDALDSGEAKSFK